MKKIAQLQKILLLVKIGLYELEILVNDRNVIGIKQLRLEKSVDRQQMKRSNK